MHGNERWLRIRETPTRAKECVVLFLSLSEPKCLHLCNGNMCGKD